MNHTWGAWDGLADKVHECIQLENDNPQIDVQEKPSNVSLRRFLEAGWVRGCGASQQCKTTGHSLRCYHALHIFIYLYISLHIFTYLYISLHIFTYLYILIAIVALLVGFSSKSLLSQVSYL